MKARNHVTSGGQRAFKEDAVGLPGEIGEVKTSGLLPANPGAGAPTRNRSAQTVLFCGLATHRQPTAETDHNERFTLWLRLRSVTDCGASCRLAAVAARRWRSSSPRGYLAAPAT